ncbi:MAG: GIY-YIG nuclease family protein [Anaerolineales bacterium]
MTEYYVYILTNNYKTLHAGITTDVQKRIYEHKSKEASELTSIFDNIKLVYLEKTPDIHAAIRRVSQIRAYMRTEQIALIEASNPNWDDLSARSS